LTGALRHGAECSNFYFPQEMDTQYLIVWEGLSPVRWQYVDPDELQTFLLARVEDGFAFPLNPKWVLCDEGWMIIFEALLKSTAASQPMEAWFPQASGLRERIFEIAKNHPQGFQQLLDANGAKAPSLDASIAMQELRRYQTLKRAHRKLHALSSVRSGVSRATTRRARGTETHKFADGKIRRQSWTRSNSLDSSVSALRPEKTEQVTDEIVKTATEEAIAAATAPPASWRARGLDSLRKSANQLSFRNPIGRATKAKGEASARKVTIMTSADDSEARAKAQ